MQCGEYVLGDRITVDEAPWILKLEVPLIYSKGHSCHPTVRDSAMMCHYADCLTLSLHSADDR